MTTKTAHAGFALLLALGLGACSRETNVDMACQEGLINEAQTCDASQSCACGSEGICFDGVCRLKCESDAACSGGGLCIKDSGGNGACMLLSEQGCSASDPCDNPRFVCGGDGKCRLPCNSANPCPSNDQECLFGACYGANEKSATWTCDGADARSEGNLRCKGATLESCNTLGLGWLPLMTCGSSEQCAAGLPTGACIGAACMPDAYNCNGRALQRCNSAGMAYETIETCATVDLCMEGIQGTKPTGKCGTVCTPGSYACEGASLKRCADDGASLQFVETCATDGLCAAAITSGSCGAAKCATDEMECQGASLRKCNAARTAFENYQTCSSATMCLPGIKGKCMAGGLELIDNLEDNDSRILTHDGRDGGWFGVSHPSADSRFEIVESTDRLGSRYAGHFVGSNSLAWGPELFIQLANDKTFDATKYAGLQFWAKRIAGDSYAALRVSDINTLPGIGTCSVERSECYGFWVAEFELTQTWRLFQFKWDQLAHAYPVNSAFRAGVDASKLVRVAFSFGAGDTDFYVDDLAFIPKSNVATCTPGALRCAGAGLSSSGMSVGSSLERCVTNGAGWEFVDDCGTERACAGEAGSTIWPSALQLGYCPTTCSPNQGRCQGRELSICDAKGSGYKYSETCASPAYCIDGAHPRCNQPGLNVIDDFEGGHPSTEGWRGTQEMTLYHAGRSGYWTAYSDEERYAGVRPIAIRTEDATRSSSGYSVLSWSAPSAAAGYMAGLITHLASYNTNFAFDASAYAGIYYSARSPTNTAIRVRLEDESTSPFGGKCSAVECAIPHSVDQALTNQWATHYYAFGDFRLPAGAATTLAASIDPKKLHSLNIQRIDAPGASEFLLDDVGFYPASVTTPCTSGGYACLGPILQRCNSAGTALDTITVCNSASDCNAGKSEAMCSTACVAKSGQCHGANLFTCTTKGAVTGTSLSQTCLSAVQCEGGLTPKCWDDALIDNFDAGGYEMPVHDGRTGSWFANTWSATGTVEGINEVLTVSTDVTDGRVLRFSGVALATDSGSGFANAALNLGGPNGGKVFDAAALAYKGVRFRARSVGGTSMPVRFELVDAPNAPEGGICTTVEPNGTCYAFFGATTTVTSNWQVFELPWATLIRLWTPSAAPSTAPDTARILSLRWLAKSANFSIEFDDIEFIK